MNEGLFPSLEDVKKIRKEELAILKNEILHLQKIVMEETKILKRKGHLRDIQLAIKCVASVIIVSLVIVGSFSYLSFALGGAGVALTVVLFLGIGLFVLLAIGNFIIKEIKRKGKEEIAKNLKALNEQNVLPRQTLLEHLEDRLRFLEHYEEKAFDQFFKNIEDENAFLKDKTKFLNLHRLYEIENLIRKFADKKPQ